MGKSEVLRVTVNAKLGPALELITSMGEVLGRLCDVIPEGNDDLIYDVRMSYLRLVREAMRQLGREDSDHG